MFADLTFLEVNPRLARDDTTEESFACTALSLQFVPESDSGIESSWTRGAGTTRQSLNVSREAATRKEHFECQLILRVWVFD